ncbi:MAG: hypothetical protein GX111_09875 [Clostridiales bacterium]|nr:hypothetical protein [Clostridiales bacterium]
MSNRKLKRKRRFGDRKDGRLLRSLSPFYRFTPFIMKQRNEATNYFKEKFEITEAEKYLRALREEGYPGIGFLHVFLAAYIRCVAQFPSMNRFISGQRIYARNNIEINLIIKKKMSMDAEEENVKVFFEPTDGIRDVYRIIGSEIEKNKKESADNHTSNTANLLIKLPRIFLRMVVRLVYWLDYHGRVPATLLRASPFHGSLFVTDLGSIGVAPVYHHLYNFGNIPIFIAFGAKRKEYELNAEGKVVTKKYIDYTINLDERIADGYTFALVFRYLRQYLKNPRLLEKPLETIARDID